MGNKKKKPSEIGFFFRHDFKDQLRRMQTVAQVMEVLDAASDYVISGNFEIKDPLSDMAFSCWKPRLDYDKAEYKDLCDRNKHNSQKAKEKRDKQKKDVKGVFFQNSPSNETTEDEIPLVDVEEVEKYPFEEFWKIYGKEVGFEDCQRIWNRQFSNETKAEIMAHVVEYVKARPNVYFRKDPINYFKERCWKDKVITNPQTESNYGSNNGKYNNREAQRQQNLREMGEWLAEAAANVQPINPTESGI